MLRFSLDALQNIRSRQKPTSETVRALTHASSSTPASVKTSVKLFILLSVAISSTAQAQSPSAIRNPTESFAEIERRVESLRLRRSTHLQSLANQTSSFDMRVPLQQVNLNSVPAWQSSDNIAAVFRRIRDERFLADRTRPHFPRRLSWLYPDDGCYSRAELAAELLEEWGYPKPAKIFIYGELNVRTNNSPAGEVSWWYHVVVGYRVNNNQILIFDPAIESSRPLSLRQWSEKMGTEAQLPTFTFSVCDSNTYGPYTRCVGGRRTEPESTREDIKDFLDAEWDRQASLGRDPSALLGANPPWISGIQDLFPTPPENRLPSIDVTPLPMRPWPVAPPARTPEVISIRTTNPTTVRPGLTAARVRPRAAASAPSAR